MGKVLGKLEHMGHLSALVELQKQEPEVLGTGSSEALELPG